MNRQRTIEKPAVVQGRGLFSGEPCRLRFVPAECGEGIAFLRIGEGSPTRIPPDIEHLAKRARRTSLQNGHACVETVEHVLAAVAGLGIDNVTIELTADETPCGDGSSLVFVEALQQAGIIEQQAEREVAEITEPISVSEGDTMLAALPGSADCLDILFDLDYSEVPSIGRQVRAFRLGQDDFVREIAPSRTFCLTTEAEQLQARGQCLHLSPKDILVMGPEGPVDNELRFADEHVRHKICDLIGDLALLGQPLRGRVVAYKAGHGLNHALVRKLKEAMTSHRRDDLMAAEPPMDIRRIMRLLPHRYPFLMVDRIIKIEGDRKAVGIKNVSINEPYFQGHFPSQPVMPGVMIVEAMAQLAGILVTQRLEHTGKIGFLVSMDSVKLRRQVRPGDQLILEAEAISVRTRTAHCACRAMLGDDVAAEANIKFILLDAEPV